MGRRLMPLLLLLLAQTAGAAEPSAIDVAKRVQAVYAAAKTYRAKFKQTFVSRVQGVRRVSTGRVAFARPGKLSFRYSKPKGARVVCDGKVVKVYDPIAKRVYHTKAKRSQYPAAIAFLQTKAKLTRMFKLRLIRSERVKGAYVLDAVPKRKRPAFARLVLYIDAKTHHVLRVLVIDSQGNFNRFDLSAPVLGGGIPKKEFRFRPPRGTRVVKP